AEARRELGAEAHGDLAGALVGGGDDHVAEGLLDAGRTLGRPRDDDVARGAGREGGAGRGPFGEAGGEAGRGANVVLVAADGDAGDGEGVGADVADAEGAGVG